MAEEFEIAGLAELDEKLGKMSAEMGYKVLRSAGMNATKPLLDEMRATAPSASSEEAIAKREKRGILPLADVTRRWSEKPNDEHSCQIHVGYRSKDHWWAGMLELGTQHIAPVGWMRRAAENNVELMLSRLKKSLGKRLERYEKTGK